MIVMTENQCNLCTTPVANGMLYLKMPHVDASYRLVNNAYRIELKVQAKIIILKVTEVIAQQNNHATQF